MADNVIVRVPEQQFIKGEDGYSPEVTIENIDHGHRITITDREHPEGQTADVLDGDSAYEQAVAGGYTGTEAQFNEELASFKELSDETKDAAPFYAEYGVTTKAEIETAINGKRQIYVHSALGMDYAPLVGTFLYLPMFGNVPQTGYRFATVEGTTQYIYDLRDEWFTSENDLAAPAQRAETAAAQALTRMNSADASAQDSEAYAIGKRNGVDVGAGDPASNNNSKYYMELAAHCMAEASSSETAAASSMRSARNYASSAQNYAGQATSSASDAATAKTAAETAQGLAESAQAAAETAQGAAEDAQEAAEAVLASIPSDYTELTEDVDDLKSAVQGVAIHDTASGDIASFYDGADGVPIKSLTVNIERVQSGGWAGCTVTRTGKNLFNIPSGTLKVGSINKDTGVIDTSASTSRYTENMLKIKGGANYAFQCVFSGSPQAALYMAYYDSNGAFLERVVLIRAAQAVAGAWSGVVQMRGDASYIRLCGLASLFAFTSNWQIEEGNEITDYEPYQGNTYSITFPTEAGAVSNGTVDVINGVLETGGNSYQIEPLTIPTLYGLNNIWADCGSVSVVYPVDTQSVIDKHAEDIVQLQGDLTEQATTIDSINLLKRPTNSILANADFDDYTEDGVYRVTSAGIAAQIAHIPANRPGKLIVSHVTYNTSELKTMMQVYITVGVNPPEIYVRHASNSFVGVEFHAIQFVPEEEPVPEEKYSWQSKEFLIHDPEEEKRAMLDVVKEYLDIDFTDTYNWYGKDGSGNRYIPAAKVYELWDALQQKYPEYIDPGVVIGHSKDPDGNDYGDIKAYYIHPRNSYVNSSGANIALPSLDVPTVYITAGTHGIERTPPWTLFEIFRRALETNTVYSEFLTGLQFRVIPVLDIWCYDNGKRYLAAAYDANGNEKYSGDALEAYNANRQCVCIDDNNPTFASLNIPTYATEAQALTDYMQLHHFGDTAGDCYLDLHNCSSSLGYLTTDNPDIGKMYRIMIDELAKDWAANTTFANGDAVDYYSSSTEDHNRQYGKIGVWPSNVHSYAWFFGKAVNSFSSNTVEVQQYDTGGNCHKYAFAKAFDITYRWMRVLFNKIKNL